MLIRKLPCKPRSCESCERRGTKADDLHPYRVEGVSLWTKMQVQNEYWMHHACADELTCVPEVYSVTLIEDRTK